MIDGEIDLAYSAVKHIPVPEVAEAPVPRLRAAVRRLATGRMPPTVFQSQEIGFGWWSRDFRWGHRRSIPSA